MRLRLEMKERGLDVREKEKQLNNRTVVIEKQERLVGEMEGKYLKEEERSK